MLIMTIYIDRKYIQLLSPKLNRFSRKNDDLFNFRCPVCGDSQKNKYKARGYVFRKKNDLFYRCHNCSVGMTISNLVKYVDVNLHKEYIMERYKAGDSGHSNYEKPKVLTDFILPKFKIKLDLDTIESLSNNHYAKSYLLNRKIPKPFLNELYYAPDFRKFIDNLIPNHGKNLKENDPRIIIPFHDKDKNLIAVQGRALEADSKTRYITIKIDEHSPKIYGLDKMDKNKKIYIVEGPFDSMFIPNAIAAAGSNLTDLGRFVDINSSVIVYDNQPRNKDIVRQLSTTIESGYNVCIWPNNMMLKDINDMILDGMNISEILYIIDHNTFSGLEAKFRLQSWKKI
jgi:transcription elongation factor Elf1